ncbi:MAG: NADH-quinone oxidoreductase subunit J family protein [Chloroflexota bacterium]
MDLGAVAFYVVATATVVASLGVVLTRSAVYSALLLIASLALTGFVYLLMLSDFLALVQILVYVGTVSILLLFALMLTRPRELQVMNHRGWPLAAGGSVVALVALVWTTVGTNWAALTPRVTATGPTVSTSSSVSSSARFAAEEVRRFGPEEIGTALFTVWAVPFEIASVVLLIALIGSLLIARATDLEDEAATGTVAGAEGGSA